MFNVTRRPGTVAQRVEAQSFLVRIRSLELKLIDWKGWINSLGPGMKSTDHIPDTDFRVAEFFLKSSNGDLRVVSPPTDDDNFFAAVVANAVQ